MTAKKNALFGAFLLASLEYHPVKAQQEAGETTYLCEAVGTQLQGKLTEAIFYGPPGFGETPAQDARERAFILELVTPITVKPKRLEVSDSTCLSVFRHVRRVQLEFLHMPATRVGKAFGRTVVVSGTLDEAAAPSEHTDVTMIVESIRPLK